MGEDTALDELVKRFMRQAPALFSGDQDDAIALTLKLLEQGSRAELEYAARAAYAKHAEQAEPEQKQQTLFGFPVITTQPEHSEQMRKVVTQGARARIEGSVIRMALDRETVDALVYENLKNRWVGYKHADYNKEMDYRLIFEIKPEGKNALIITVNAKWIYPETLALIDMDVKPAYAPISAGPGVGYMGLPASIPGNYAAGVRAGIGEKFVAMTGKEAESITKAVLQGLREYLGQQAVESQTAEQLLKDIADALSRAGELIAENYFAIQDLDSEAIHASIEKVTKLATDLLEYKGRLDALIQRNAIEQTGIITVLDGMREIKQALKELQEVPDLI